MDCGILNGLVTGTESVVFDYEVAGSPVSSINTGNILNGDEDGVYTIIWRGISTTADQGNVIFFNGDNTIGNYGARSIRAISTTVADETLYSYLANGATGNHAFCVATICAKSGSVRLINVARLGYASGTTINRIHVGGYVWNNTVDVIRSMVFKSDQTNGIAVGSRIIIIKGNNFTDGIPTGTITTPKIEKCWTRVGQHIVGVGGAASVNFEGLNGDRQVVYAWSNSFKINRSGSSAFSSIRPNSIASGYGYQLLDANSTTIGATRGTSSNFGYLLGYGAGTAHGNIGTTCGIMFAKSGFIRPAIANVIDDINGATIRHTIQGGFSINNTSDNIISMLFYPSGGTFDEGSQFDLYALYQ